ncbi:hypothetical protein GGS20DRAFT_581405 [Poronia punctata]|nr:hypothetical protein GGS20DRAFT_581405 [Poronia punctata]
MVRSITSASVVLATLSRFASAAGELCPEINNIGHAAPESYVFSNLNWTLTQRSSGAWPPLDNDFDESRVSFDIESAFNDASVSCTAEGKEFSEEYTRQLAGRSEPVYNWYECEGDSEDVKTEFKMVWWNPHTVEIKQTWTCPETNRAMRATGKTSILGQFDCVYADDSSRTQCLSYNGVSLAFEADTVQILDPPPRNCAAASEATPNWNVLDLVYTKTDYPLFAVSFSDITFRLINEALDYSPRMFCVEPELHGPQGGVYETPYSCSVFEANEEDVPITKFDLIVDSGKLLRINQTWTCDDGGSSGTTFQSIGELNVDPFLSCTSETIPVSGGAYNEVVTTCTSTEEFEITGELQ